MELSGGGGGGSAAMNVDGAGGVRAAVQDLFNLYLARPLINKRVANERGHQISKVGISGASTNRAHPPKDEQFALDFLQLQNHFPDPEQLQSSAESVLALLLVQCSSHSLQVEFLLFALQTLARLGFLRWDSFIPLLLHAVATLESSGLQPGLQNTVLSPGSQSVGGGAGHVMLMGGSGVLPSASGSPAQTSTRIGSPAYSAADVSTNFFQSSSVVGIGNKVMALVWLCPLVCKILLAALDTDLKPVVANDILVQIVNWINQWDSNLSDNDEGKIQSVAWLHSCVELIWALIDESKCRVPFYALLHDRSRLQVEHWPEDGGLFALFLEVHRRRDKIALHMLMLDHHLHCPTFATLRMTALTYPGTLGEPLHGEDIANAVPRGSLDWERAMRCLSHALHCNPSADWWRRVLVLAPRYRQQAPSQGNVQRPGPVSMTQPAPEFSSDMICDAVVDRIMELMQRFQTPTDVIAIDEDVITIDDDVC